MTVRDTSGRLAGGD